MHSIYLTNRFNFYIDLPQYLLYYLYLLIYLLSWPPSISSPLGSPCQAQVHTPDFRWIFFASRWILPFAFHLLKRLKNHVSILCSPSPLDRRAPHGSVRKSCIPRVCGGPALSTHSGIQQPKIVHQAKSNLVAEQSIAYISVWGVGGEPLERTIKVKITN